MVVKMALYSSLKFTTIVVVYNSACCQDYMKLKLKTRYAMPAIESADRKM